MKHAVLSLEEFRKSHTPIRNVNVIHQEGAPQPNR